MDNTKTFECACGTAYAQKQGLYRHRKTCDIYNNKHCDTNIQKDVCSNNLNQEQLITLQADNARLYELLRVQQEQIHKLDNDKIQLQKLVTELQERERCMLIEQVRTLQSQLSNKTETVIIVEPPKAEQPIVEVSKIAIPYKNEQPKVEPSKITETNKKPSVKSYLTNCNPVTFTLFMDKYVPTIDDYTNVIRYGIEEGIIKNIITYLLTHKKENYPIIVTNQQAKRMRMLVYDTKDESNQWNKYESYKAREFLEDMSNRYSNKLYKYVTTVFKSYYSGMDDRDHPDHINHSEQRHALYGQLRYAEMCSRKIANRLVEHFVISNEEDDGASECENDYEDNNGE